MGNQLPYFIRRFSMNFNDYDNEIALERQIRLILNTLKNVTEGYNYYNFRCHICGDSKKSKSKKRGYILKQHKPWVYYCHNCFYKKPVLSWMKEFFPIHYKDYFREVLREKKDKVNPLPKVEIKKVKKIDDEKDQVKYFIPIKKGITPAFAKAVRMCLDRKIPEEIWSKWYVAIGGKYSNRMIIPFFDQNNKIYYYQGRSLFGQDPKYLSRKGKYNNIYNYYIVDKNKPVIILEGCIDSIFVENSVAMTGVKIEDKKLKEFPHKRYLIDFDNETEETKKKTIELLSKGEFVFCWKKFMKAFNLPIKSKWDINDVCIHLNREKFAYSELEPFFTNSLFDKVFFI